MRKSELIVILISICIVQLGLPEPAMADVQRVSGKLTMLRVHEVGTGYGPPPDFIDVEVVFKVDSRPGMAFGFQLRNDDNLPARQECSTCSGMPSTTIGQYMLNSS